MVMIPVVRCSTLPEMAPIVEQPESELSIAADSIAPHLWMIEGGDRLDEAPFQGSRLLPPYHRRQVYPALDRFVADRFRLLRGKRFALLTNGSGLDSRLNPGYRSMIEMGTAPTLLLEPEHGLYGYADELLANGLRKDPLSGIPVLSLYSNERKGLQPGDLNGIDLVVIDVAMLSVRCYTYISTLTEIFEYASANHIGVVVLDRPDPYDVFSVAGAFPVAGSTDFVARAPVPFLYGLTPGEFAIYMARTHLPELRLMVAPVSGYRRGRQANFTGSPWINLSPNIPSLGAAYIYPAVVFFEGTNLSLGRGTSRPFEYSGAPWLEAPQVIQALRKLELPGVVFNEVTFRPTASLYTGEVCKGIQITPVDQNYDPVRTGFEYMRIVRSLHPKHFEFKQREGVYFVDRLWGNDGYRLSVEQDRSYAQFSATWQPALEQYQTAIEAIRLY